MRINLFYLFLLSLLTFSACKTSYTSPADYPKNQLVFGSGGGFAGTVKTYYLLEDGAVFQAVAEDSTLQKINQVDKSDTKALFAEAEDLSLPTRQLDQPGNMYAFVEWRGPETQNRLVWDMSGMGVAPELVSFHRQLMQYATPTR
jgi:hypothetical protein